MDTKQKRKFSERIGYTRNSEMPTTIATAREGHVFASETPNTFHSAEEIDDSDEEFFDVEEASNSDNFKESPDSRKEKDCQKSMVQSESFVDDARKSKSKKENQVLMEPKSNERKSEDAVMQMNTQENKSSRSPTKKRVPAGIKPKASPKMKSIHSFKSRSKQCQLYQNQLPHL